MRLTPVLSGQFVMARGGRDHRLLQIIAGCAQEKKSPIQGVWTLVYGNWSGMEKTLPDQIKGSQIKVFSQEYWVYVGHAEWDSTVVETSGGGTYTLEGNRFNEKRLYPPKNSKEIKILLEIRNDTLIQRWPADENWQLSEKYSTEKYVRVK